MCGIFGYLGSRENTPEIILSGLKSLEYRGYDSWGIVVVKDGRAFLKKEIGKIGRARVDNLPESTFGLGHTRWATHGGVTKVNSHPHADCTGRFAIVHNGIIENYDQIRLALLKKGHKFISETDSEVAAHLIEEYSKRLNPSEAVRRAFLEFEGLNALIVMDVKKEIFIGIKTGSSLVVGVGKGESFLASDAVALLPYTRMVHFLDDGETVVIDRKGIRLLAAESSEKIVMKPQKIDWKVEQARLGKYRHFMIKEICEQPRILTGVVEGAISQVPFLSKIVRKAYGTYMVGCGTAAYAALCGTYLFSRIAKRHVNFAVGSEFIYLTDFLRPESLVIAFSQSGETIDIVEAMKKVKEKKAKILAVTNVLGSSLYRMADYRYMLNAGPEKCVLATKSFTAKLAFLLLLSESLNGGLEKGREKIFQAIRVVKKLIASSSLRQIKSLADRISKAKNIYVVGRGLSYPVAMEAALKIKEVSYIHAEGFAAGELKHGVIALIEKGTPCFVYAPNDETYGAVLSGAMEMRARGGKIIGISFKKHEIFDEFVEVTDCGDASSIPNAVVAQLIAYYLALKKGNDPDKPRNLAKSVTVK